MFCPSCGTKVPDGTKFCPECGTLIETPAEENVQAPEPEFVPVQPVSEPAPAPVAETPAAPAETPANTVTAAAAVTGALGETQKAVREKVKKVKEKTAAGKGGMKKWLILGIAALALVAVAIVLIVVLTSGGGGGGAKVAKATPAKIFYVDGKYLSAEADTKVQDALVEDATNVRVNSKGTYALVEMDDELYLFDGKEMTKVLDEIPKMYQFSGVGEDGFVFVQDDDAWAYENGKTIQLSEDEVFSKTETYTIRASVDGKYYIYSFQKSNGSYQSYVWNNGKVTELDKNQVPYVISAGGKYMYYIKYNTSKETASFYVRKGITGEDEEELIKDISASEFVAFNVDGTECAYSVSGRTYISVNGQEGEKILSADSPELLLPYGESLYTQFNAVYNVASFKNHFYYINGTVWYLNNKMEAYRVARNVSYQYVLTDGKTLVYQDDENCVYRVDGTNENNEPELLIEDDSNGFVPTKDGSVIFFRNFDNEIMAQKGTNKAVRVSDEGDWYRSYSSMFDGKTLFYVIDGELYSSDGEKGTKLKLGDDVKSVSCRYGFILINGEESILYSTNGKDFTTIYEKEVQSTSSKSGTTATEAPSSR